MTKAERSKAKEVPYLVPAVFRESPSLRRTDDAILCNLIFSDIDEEKDGECPAAKFVNDKASLVDALTPFAFAAYTTASNTAEKPRMRVVVSASDIPLNAIADTASLYILDPKSGAVTLVGTAGGIAYVQGDGSPVDCRLFQRDTILILIPW